MLRRRSPEGKNFPRPGNIVDTHGALRRQEEPLEEIRRARDGARARALRPRRAGAPSRAETPGEGGGEAGRAGAREGLPPRLRVGRGQRHERRRGRHRFQGQPGAGPDRRRLRRPAGRRRPADLELLRGDRRQDHPRGRQGGRARQARVGAGRAGRAEGALRLLHRQPEHPAAEPEPDVQAPEGIRSAGDRAERGGHGRHVQPQREGPAQLHLRRQRHPGSARADRARDGRRHDDRRRAQGRDPADRRLQVDHRGRRRRARLRAVAAQRPRVHDRRNQADARQPRRHPGPQELPLRLGGPPRHGRLRAVRGDPRRSTTTRRRR